MMGILFILLLYYVEVYTAFWIIYVLPLLYREINYLYEQPHRFQKPVRFTIPITA